MDTLESTLPPWSDRSDDASGDILVVDDKPENFAALQAALCGLGYRLIGVRSGREALHRLLQLEVSLILLDVQMPGMDGLETARQIRARERSRHVPIIFITGYHRDDDEVLEAYRLGAVDFLTKPVRPEILEAKVSVLMDLQRRTAQVERQAQLIRAHILQERESALAEQRSRLEAHALKQRLEEQRSHAAELESLNRRLAENDRRKDEFIALLGHELRNPLAPLVAGLELLASADAEAAERTRRVMRRQVDHLIRLVDDLLDMSRVTRGKIELRRARLRASDVLDQAILLATPLIEERRHSLFAQRAGAELWLDGDEVRLTQVLANLLNNAARYTDPGGVLEVSCRGCGDGVEFQVKDNGRGISPELLPRIFDLFVQEHAGGGGLGIGLTLVKHLVQMHRGKVVAKSAGPGQGSEFCVWLPEADAGAGVQGEAPVAEPETGPAPLTVTLVEDNDDVRGLLCEVLESWGHCVTQAATGELGLATILSERPDVAFIDIGLPDMDGYELVRQVRAACGNAPPRLVALSGYGRRGDRERALGVGFDDHLAKPAAPEVLQQLLGEVRRQRG